MFKYLIKNTTLLIFGILTLTKIQAQEPVKSFSFDDIKKNGKNINSTAQNLLSYDNTKINYYQFKPDKPAVAKLVFIHGGGAHSKLGYFQLAKTLKDNFSIETILIDLRGHGLSDGKRGDSPKVNSLYKDLNALIQKVNSKNNIPLYLGGHSSGGGLLLNYSTWKKRADVDGFLFVSPEFGYKSKTEREHRIPFAEVKIGKFVINGITQGLLMQHSNVVFFNYPKEILKENPLILEAITVNMSKSLTPKKPIKQVQKITEPIAIFIGEHDELFNPEKVVNYASLPLTKNKKTVTSIIPNQNHLSILNDIGTTLGQTILNWNN